MLKNEETMKFSVKLSVAVALLASLVGTEEVPDVSKQSDDPAELTWAALEKFHEKHHKKKHDANRHNSTQEREVHGHHHKHHHKHQGGLGSAQDSVALAARKQSKSVSAEEAEWDWPSLFDTDMYGSKEVKSKKTKKHEDDTDDVETKVEEENDSEKAKDDRKAKDDEDKDLDEDEDEAEPKPVKKHAVKKSPKNAKPQKTEVKKVKVKTQDAKTSKDDDEDDEEAPVVGRSLDVSEPKLPFGDMEPFGREATAQQLTEDSIRQSNAMVDQIEKAELAEEQRSVFRALTRLRGAALASFDGVARSATGNIQEYAARGQWRDNHPVTHLAEEEGDVEKWAFPSNAD